MALKIMFKSLPIQMVQGDTEDLIQMINPEQESDLKQDDLPDQLSILPIKNTVLFPGVVIPITVGRQTALLAWWHKKIHQLKNLQLMIYTKPAR
jgi:ATP-dependent Lon protease